ncbi:MAG: D-alanyl-D-alanine carboxypeptidase family protein [Clostridia bacterium]|nr:D-alanyl-D-alanine carboxypeptidase family protein [Clostridia bacterium]
MPQKHGTRGRKKRSPYLFMILAAILMTALVIVGARAMNAWNLYETEAAVTPTPSSTVRPISVTPDPNRATPAPTNTPAPTPSPVPTATPSVLSVGSQGQMVKDLQTRLKELGYYEGNIDGDYGSGTKAAVEAFQQVNGLDADGIAGQKTLSVLYSESALPKPGPVDTLESAIPLLVNKWNSLPAAFEPKDLVTVKSVVGSLMTYERNDIQGVREAAEALARMIQAAINDGVSPWKLREGYRTIADQRRIFNNRVNTYMKENELTRSQAIARTRQSVADPGQSEHHTGLAFDLNVPGQSFGDTAQYIWLKQNCWDYGFIMRYTDEKDDITGIVGEEWHVRYVGVNHAQRMRDLDMCLEEYVEYLSKQ